MRSLPLAVVLGVVLPLFAAAELATLDGPDGPELPVRVERPSGLGPFPAVVLLHGCKGVGTAEQEWAEFLSAEGYLVVLPHTRAAHSLGGTCGASEEGLERELAARRADAQRALAFLLRQPEVDPARIAVMGLSRGGSGALASASQTAPFRAAVGVYPLLADIEVDNRIPVLVVSGRDDGIALPRYVREAQRRAEAEGRPFESRILAGAAHGFDDARYVSNVVAPAVRSHEFDANARARARREVVRFLGERMPETALPAAIAAE